MRLMHAALMGLVVLVAACSSGPKEDGFAYDPYQETNREFHQFNKGLDTVLLRPAAVVYDEAMPGLGKHLIRNGLDTLRQPSYFVNHLLQGDFEAAGETFARLGVNLIMGLGVLDPATEFGLKTQPNDMGRTFAAAGADEGAYVELPLFGPSTGRDAVGRVVGIVTNPLFFVTASPVSEIDTAGTIVTPVELRQSNMRAIDEVLYNTEDSYIVSRAAYLQLRRRQVGAETTEEDLPDLFDDEAFE